MGGLLDEMMEHLIASIENPGVACAREEFVIYKPAHMSDEDWTAWCAEMRDAMADPSVRHAAAEQFQSRRSA